jgi:hypothetical protein
VDVSASPPVAAERRASPCSCSASSSYSLVAGGAPFLAISVGGFLVMLAGAVLAVTSAGSGSAGQAPPPKDAETDRNRFTGRMEERFRRRFEQE